MPNVFYLATTAILKWAPSFVGKRKVPPENVLLLDAHLAFSCCFNKYERNCHFWGNWAVCVDIFLELAEAHNDLVSYPSTHIYTNLQWTEAMLIYPNLILTFRPDSNFFILHRSLLITPIPVEYSLSIFIGISTVMNAAPTLVWGSAAITKQRWLSIFC